MSAYDDLSRRDLLSLLGLGALAIRLPDGASWPARPTPARTAVAPFALRDVRVLGGPFRDAEERNARYLLSLEPDRLLHNFRVNAALAPRAAVYGGWESEEPWVDIRCHGHTLGHYLGAVAMQYAASGDRRFAERAEYIVGELQECQRARGDGLVCAFPDGAKPLEDAVAGRRFAGVPWYTMHKIFSGLRDAHEHAATPGALPVLVALTEWTWRATKDMSDAAMQRMLDTEHGGMTEVLADVSVLAGERRYLDLAKRFAHQRVLVPLAEGRDVLDGLHSNTQIPKFVGYQRLNALTGDTWYGDAARFFWSTVTSRRSYVTGGNGDGEHYFPVSEFAARLGSAKTMETCCTHNMLRLTRALFAQEPDATLADYYERALFNGILASQDPESGMTTYFQATRPGYVRLFHTPDESFWCCTGTGIENHAKYGDSIYFHDEQSLYVNLYVASQLTWRDRDVTVTQVTRFPDEPRAKLRVQAERLTRFALKLRIPAWCANMSVTLNGRSVRGDRSPSGYLTIDREWKSGDTVDVELPMTLRTESLPGSPDRVAFCYGPIVLAGALGSEGLTPGSQIIKNERTSGDMLHSDVDIPELVGDPAQLVRHVRPIEHAPLTFETTSIGRPRDVRLVPFFRLAHERYNLYWKVRSA